MSPQRGLAQTELRHRSGDIYRAGHWYVHTAELGTQGATDGRIVVRPTEIYSSIQIDRIGTNIATLGASSTVRLGIYQIRTGAAATFADLILDAGTVDSSTTGDKEITIAQALDPGIYLFVAVAQGGTPPGIRSNNRANAPSGSSIMQQTAFGLSGGGSGSRPYVWNSVTGALAATLPGPGSAGEHPYVVGFRVA